MEDNKNRYSEAAEEAGRDNAASANTTAAEKEQTGIIKGKVRRKLFLALLAVVLILALLATAAWAVFSSYYGKLNYRTKEEDEALIEQYPEEGQIAAAGEIPEEITGEDRESADPAADAQSAPAQEPEAEAGTTAAPEPGKTAAAAQPTRMLKLAAEAELSAAPESDPAADEQPVPTENQAGEEALPQLEPEEAIAEEPTPTTEQIREEEDPQTEPEQETPAPEPAPQEEAIDAALAGEIPEENLAEEEQFHENMMQQEMAQSTHTVSELMNEPDFVPPEDWDYNTNKVHNILLIGVDNDKLGSMDKRGNADGIILLSINEKTKQVVLTSFMRDIDVRLENGSHTKLTLTYHLWGVSGLIDAIENGYHIPIDNYVLVNYLNLIDIVDAFGGVTLDVTAEELYWMQEKIDNLNTLTGQTYGSNIIPVTDAGRITLNGVQTAAYLRIRYAGNGDFDRTARARIVLTELKNKALKMSLSELNDMLDTVLPCIQTDLTQRDIIGLGLKAGKILKYEVVSQRIPIEGSYRLVWLVGSEVLVDHQVNGEYLYYTIYEGHSPDPTE